MKKTLVIIPTYNEIENIESIIHKVFEIKLDLNILVVDDNSPDGTGDLVNNLMNKYSKKLFLLKKKTKGRTWSCICSRFFVGNKMQL